MEVRKVKEGFAKGISLVVGREEVENKYKTDLTVVHTSYCLSDTPYFIDYKYLDLSNLQENEVIYICGHGKDGKIAGREMGEIARILVDKGYRGLQDIYITSCYSKGEITKRLSEEIIKLLKEQEDKEYSFEVASSTEGSSITILNERGLVEQYEVEEETLLQKFVSEVRGVIYKMRIKNIQYTEQDKVHHNLMKDVNKRRGRLIK